ncbi:MAG: hypothetical protein QM758_10905 [Armatimonas sp.]
MKTTSLKLACIVGILLAIAGVTCSGCGSSPAPTLIGTWTRAAIGQPGQAESALATCPGSISVDGSPVSCRASDQLIIDTNALVIIDMVDAEGRPTQTSGTYSTPEGSESQLTHSKLLVETTLDGGTHTALYVRSDPS